MPTTAASPSRGRSRKKRGAIDFGKALGAIDNQLAQAEGKTKKKAKTKTAKAKDKPKENTFQDNVANAMAEQGLGDDEAPEKVPEKVLESAQEMATRLQNAAKDSLVHGKIAAKLVEVDPKLAFPVPGAPAHAGAEALRSPPKPISGPEQSDSPAAAEFYAEDEMEVTEDEREERDDVERLLKGAKATDKHAGRWSDNMLMIKCTVGPMKGSTIRQVMISQCSTHNCFQDRNNKKHFGLCAQKIIENVLNKMRCICKNNSGMRQRMKFPTLGADKLKKVMYDAMDAFELRFDNFKEAEMAEAIRSSGTTFYECDLIKSETTAELLLMIKQRLMHVFHCNDTYIDMRDCIMQSVEGIAMVDHMMCYGFPIPACNCASPCWLHV